MPKKKIDQKKALRKLLIDMEKVQRDSLWRLDNIGLTWEARAKERGRLEVAKTVIDRLYKLGV